MLSQIELPAHDFLFDCQRSMVKLLSQALSRRLSHEGDACHLGPTLAAQRLLPTNSVRDQGIFTTYEQKKAA
jgi:hypothetical protein